MTAHRSVLILGADGFIGRHMAFAARAAGWRVIAHARRTKALTAMGFETVQADLSTPETHAAAFWAPHLAHGAHLINCAGVLNASQTQFEAVHVQAPAAAYAALDRDARGVLISAVGIEADTSFAKWRRAGEAAASTQVSILRPGLVMADTSYGGTSLARALAALPLRTPVIGDGQQVFNPIHAEDLAQIALHCLENPPPQGAHLVGGPQDITQSDLADRLRGWLGHAPLPKLHLPLRIAHSMGRIGDALNLGPISRTAIAQLEHGVHAPMSAQLNNAPPARGVAEFIATRPAGSQDIWHARLYLMRPLVRLTLAFMWIFSGILGLTLAPDTFLPLMQNSILGDNTLIAMARIGGGADIAIAGALLRNWRPKLMTLIQLGLVGGYTLTFTLLAPALWLLPIGGLLKNLPILVLIGVWSILERER